METAIRALYGLFHVEPTHPWLILLALLAIPAYHLSRSSAGRVVFSSLRALPLGGHTWRTRLAWLPDALIALSVVALAIALTGPRAGDQSARVRRDGIAVMMAVDVSGSMRALDLSERNRELTRLDAVKQTFERFVLGGGKLAGRPDDAIGLVAFASYAETRSPLTSMPRCRSSSISPVSTAGSITTPLPMIESLPCLTTPEGSSDSL